LNTVYVNMSCGIDQNAIERAATIIRAGGLVAFPTETVYGLGANGFDPVAVAKIFKAKGRPQDNPLILHIADIKELDRLTTDVPEDAMRLAHLFWPGPLTMVLRKKKTVPDAVTAGLNTVAVRMPAHEVALRLISAAGVPIAAPSANVSGRPSPTDAEHVMADLSGVIDMVIDAGPTRIGVESTVLDMSAQRPTLLRPGGLGLEELKLVLADIEMGYDNPDGPAKSPGLKHKHYAPKAPLFLYKGPVDEQITSIGRDMVALANTGNKVGVLAATNEIERIRKTARLAGLRASDAPSTDANIVYAATGRRDHMEEVASSLFSRIRQLDISEVSIILATSYLEEGLGFAVMNRLVRASDGRVINVHER
jgi:L-threonylcarbamoyladenylate synthase